MRREREQARFRLHLVKHRSMLKHRIHSTLICFGHPCPVSDLFGVAGREVSPLGEQMLSPGRGFGFERPTPGSLGAASRAAPWVDAAAVTG